ncbi:uncharacterized protein [Macaca nemestrina]|uniref:uncharacterized protein isoform X3 n=1 Tax=Macaca nemestrina TaxID=9545 RepID=UPI0039B8F140
MPIGTQSWAVHWTRWQMSFLCCCFPSPPVWAEATAFGDVLQTEAAAEAWLPEELLSSLRKKQSPTYHDHPPAWRKLHASSSDKHGNQSPANAAAHHPCSAAQQPLPHPISRASCRRAPTCLWTHTPLLLFAQGVPEMLFQQFWSMGQARLASGLIGITRSLSASRMQFGMSRPHTPPTPPRHGPHKDPLRLLIMCGPRSES